MRKYSKRQFIYSSIAWLYAEQNPTQIILLQVAYPGNVMERLRKKNKIIYSTATTKESRVADTHTTSSQEPEP
jgi:hypothetical protein